MNIKKEIQKYQIDVLKAYGLIIKKIDYKHLCESNIVYSLDFEKENKEGHASMCYNWSKQNVSIQCFFGNKNFLISNNCIANTENFHSIIVNQMMAF